MTPSDSGLLAVGPGAAVEVTTVVDTEKRKKDG